MASLVVPDEQGLSLACYKVRTVGYRGRAFHEESGGETGCLEWVSVSGQVFVGFFHTKGRCTRLDCAADI